MHLQSFFQRARILFFGFSFWVASSSADIDADRPFLKKFDEKDPPAQIKETDFDYPFLIAETVRKIPKSITKTTDLLIAALKKEELPYRSHFSSSGLPSSKIDGGQVNLPPLVGDGKQLEGIEKCNEDYCLMKLQNEEKKEMQASVDKVSRFRNIVAERIKIFVEKNQLRGYEDRKNGNLDIGKMIPLLHFMKARYPISTQFIEKEFFEKKPPPKTFRGSFFRQELVNISHDKLQPIWRIGELFHFFEKDSEVLIEIFPYSNHYLDSSIRVYEVLSHGADSLVAITDVMEIDELTKSGMVRLLYKGQMEDAVSHVESDDLESLAEAAK